MMHLGAVVGIPTFGIFGITSPARETLPLPNLFPISKQLPCEPACRELPARIDCEHHLRCLKTLTPQEVLARLESLSPRRRAGAKTASASPFAVNAEQYDASYFESGGSGGWPEGYHWHILRESFRETADWIDNTFHDAQSFLDAGCAKGFLVQSLRDQGKMCWGFDHSRCAIEHAVEPARPYLKRAGVDDYVFTQRFDILLAFDLLSHLTEQQASEFLSRARCSIDGCLLAVLPAEENGGFGRITIRDREWWRDLFVRAGWRQDFLGRNIERRLQAQPLSLRMKWDVYLYAS
jgi:SAM-dependent methyltransferase